MPWTADHRRPHLGRDRRQDDANLLIGARAAVEDLNRRPGSKAREQFRDVGGPQGLPVDREQRVVAFEARLLGGRAGLGLDHHDALGGVAVESAQPGPRMGPRPDALLRLQVPELDARPAAEKLAMETGITTVAGNFDVVNASDTIVLA